MKMHDRIMAQPTEIVRDALFSRDRKYRYLLTREWSPMFPGQAGRMLFIMLNPSSADSLVDDPTIRKCMGFARRAECTSIEVVNLFAYVPTDPRALKHTDDPIGPENDRHILEAVKRAKIVYAAWGAQPIAESRGVDVWLMLAKNQFTPRCFGRTASLQPRHPLMVPYNYGWVPFVFYCQAARDGDCSWRACPQLRDGEPKKSGRSCPLDWGDDDE